MNGLLGEENHYCWAFAIIVCFWRDFITPLLLDSLTHLRQFTAHMFCAYGIAWGDTLCLPSLYFLRLYHYYYYLFLLLLLSEFEWHMGCWPSTSTWRDSEYVWTSHRIGTHEAITFTTLSWAEFNIAATRSYVMGEKG